MMQTHSAVYATVWCLSCLSQAGVQSIWLNRLSFFRHRGYPQLILQILNITNFLPFRLNTLTIASVVNLIDCRKVVTLSV